MNINILMYEIIKCELDYNIHNMKLCHQWIHMKRVLTVLSLIVCSLNVVSNLEI